MAFSIRDGRGRVLISKGAQIAAEVGLDRFVDKDLWVDSVEADAYLRAYASRFEAIIRDAATSPPSDAAHLERSCQPGPEWPTLLFRTVALLHDPAPKNLVSRVEGLRQALLWHLAQDADRTLLVLVRSAALDLAHYTAWHSLLVAAVCEICALHLPAVMEPAWRGPLVRAALTMNVSISRLHNLLALQTHPMTAYQRAQVQDHPQSSARLLLDAGVVDALWLEAVAHHHDAVPGPLESRPPGERLGRVIQRADLFTARLSPRVNRTAMSPVEAAQVAYFDENRKPDDAGSALIKAVGVYLPGGFVTLCNGECAVVLRRGKKGNQPLVAAILNKDQTPIGPPILRDTSDPQFAVTRSLAAHEIGAGCELDVLLGLY